MKTRIARKIVKIDEDKCNGCGECIPSCAEGALQIIDGKARLISEKYCDGLGACLGECPQGAISIEEREADDYDELATEEHLHQHTECDYELPCGCSSSTVTQFEKDETGYPAIEAVPRMSMLGHWPVQLALIPPGASFLQGADVVLTADCVPFAYAGFHEDYLKDHAVIMDCPKLNDIEASITRLTNILKHSDIKSLTVVHMEVPCCSGLMYMARKAMLDSGKDIPVLEITIGIRGETL